MNPLHPKPKDHPLINDGPLSLLYKQLINCKDCPRIVNFRERIALEKRKQFKDWTYWGKPIPGFGSVNAKLLILGLAPAAHGGNRTGRVFTGDRSAEFLFRCLYDAKLSNQPTSENISDGLSLKNIYITFVSCANC